MRIWVPLLATALLGPRVSLLVTAILSALIHVNEGYMPASRVVLARRKAPPASTV